MRFLLIILFLAFGASAQEGFKFEFKDGTIVYGKVFSDRWYGPNTKGISIETMDKKIYIHDYPPTHYAPPLYTVEYNPYGIPNCSPTRISYMHFKNSTLKSLYKSYSSTNNKKHTAISKSILSSMNKKGPSNDKEVPSIKKTEEWKRRINTQYGLIIEYGNRIKFGEDMYDRKYINK